MLMSSRECVIVIYLPSSGGGVEQVYLRASGEFIRRGYSVLFLVGASMGELSGIIPEKAQIIYLKNSGPIKSISMLRHVVRDKCVVGVISSGALSTFRVIGSALMSRNFPKIIMTIHGHFTTQMKVEFRLKDWLAVKFVRFIYKFRPLMLVAVSRGVADDFSRQTRIARSDIRVIYNPVLSTQLGEQMQDRDLVCERGLPKKLVAAGRLTRQKDFKTLLKAVAKLRDESREVTLDILGEGDLHRELVALADDLGLSKVVHFRGFVSNPSFWFRNSDLFVLSSEWEGLPTVLIEALGVGTPIVSTDCPSGPSEILENGRYGRLVPVGDFCALAKAIAEALDSEHDREALRRRGAEFSVERAANQYLELLDPGGRMLTASLQ